MKLIAYLRVSTVGQVRDGLGLPTQERMVRSWCRQHGHRLLRIVSENGKSGTLDEVGRPGLLEALSAIRSGEAEGIVVTSLDRLARSLTVQEAVLARVWTEGGCVFTVEGGEVPRDDPDDPMRTAMRQMAGVFAELERRLVIKRLRNGRQTARAAGKHAEGAYPYGEHPEHPHEAETVRRMRKLAAEGRSLREIASVLKAEGHRPRRGERFHPSTVARILGRADQ